MPYHKLTLSYNAGELSPFLSHRTDIAKYESGCQQLENFIILPYGGVIRRPGTQFLGKAKFPDKKARLIGFNFSVTTNFILEFGHRYIRFWTNGVQVLKPSAGMATWVTAHAYVRGDYVMQGTPAAMYYCEVGHTSGTFATDLSLGKWVQSNVLEEPTPYADVDLRQIQYTQINDLMYLCHPNYPVQKLSRVADDNWSFGELAFKWPPLLDENITSYAVTPSGTTGNITLTANGAIFEPDDVGSLWQIGHTQAGASQSYVEIGLGATSGNSNSIRVRGDWSLITYGSWKGEVQVVRTIFRTGVTETIRSYFSSVEGQRNVSTTGTEDEDCSLSIAWITGGSAGTSSPVARIELSTARVYGLVKITGFISSTVVSGTVAWGLVSTAATIYWSEAAFSKTQGYARTVCLHEQRLVFGGNRKRPLSIHGSQIDDYENFQRGSLPDDAYMFTLSANESNPIQWMVSQSKLLIGTAGDEWALGPQNEDDALGPGNVSAKQQSSFGSIYLQARMVNEVVLFSQRQGKKLRELVYSFEKDGWVAPDLCILAAHIADNGFVETAFARQPDAILWAITEEGRLVGMTYERDQNVVGWHRHSTQGEFESVATIYGGNQADEIWFVARRTVQGADARYIERFDPAFRTTMDDEDKEKYWYLDSGWRSSNASEVTTVSGFPHLNGLTVGVLGDGANQPTRVVSAGSVTIQEPAKLVLVGLPYTSTVTPMPLNIPTQDTIQGRKLRIHKGILRLYKSLTCKFSSDGNQWNEVFFRDRDDVMDSSPNVFTGDREIFTGARFSLKQALSVKQDRPFPLCVLATVLWCDAYGE